MENCSSQRGLHPFALRESSGTTVADRLKTQVGDDAIDTPAQRHAVHSAEPAEIFEILSDGEPRVEANVIQECSDILLHLRRPNSCRFMVDRDQSRLRLEHATDGAQRGCLPGAVYPEHACNRAISGRKRQIFQYGPAIERLLEFFDFDHVRLYR